MENYEQKYKEALERAKLSRLQLLDIGEEATEIEYIFPELKESEDDRIRKELIKHLRDGAEGYMPAGNAEDYTRWLFWLEKQGEKPQGKTALEVIHEEKVDNANYVSVKELFSIGDWVVANGTRYKAKIKAFIENDMVEFEDGIFESEENLLKDYHHWTIQDAKDGDVLLSKYNQPFIYNGIFDEENVGAYCGIDKLGNDFLEDKFSCNWSYKERVKPTTKEQRDLLFQKMKEAGYEWDSYRKELRKMEQKPKWSEEDEEHWMFCLEAVEELSTQERQDFSKTIDWLRALKQRIEE